MSAVLDASPSPLPTAAAAATPAVQPIWIDSATKLLLKRLADDATLLAAVLFNTPTVGCHHVQRHVQQRGPRLLEEAIQLARRKHIEYDGLHKDVAFAADFAAATNGAARRSVESIGLLAKQALELHRRNRVTGNAASAAFSKAQPIPQVSVEAPVEPEVASPDVVPPREAATEAAVTEQAEVPVQTPAGEMVSEEVVEKEGEDTSVSEPLQDAAVSGFSNLAEPCAAADGTTGESTEQSQ